MSELAISRGGRASSPATPATASPSARQSARERPPRATGTNRNVSRKRRRNGSPPPHRRGGRAGPPPGGVGAEDAVAGGDPHREKKSPRHTPRVDVPCVGHD